MQEPTCKYSASKQRYIIMWLAISYTVYNNNFASLYLSLWVATVNPQKFFFQKQNNSKYKFLE